MDNPRKGAKVGSSAVSLGRIHGAIVSNWRSNGVDRVDKARGPRVQRPPGYRL